MLLYSNYNKNIHTVALMLQRFINLFVYDCGLPNVWINSNIRQMKTNNIDGLKVTVALNLKQRKF